MSAPSSIICREGSRRFLFPLLLPLILFFSREILAQVGNNNPTGPAGQFNGNVTTGCSYDPYTANASRAITDMVLAGSVGTYPLAFSRVSNSRYGLGQAWEFGDAGMWRHSYTWGIDGSEESQQVNFQPTQYPVYFPDGRIETFIPSSSDPYFRAAAGVRERFIPLNVNTRLAYLVLPDGGKIEFLATPYSYTQREPGPPSTPTPDWVDRASIADDDLPPAPPQDAPGTRYYGYHYRAQAIIDPYGLRTSLTYNSDGSLNVIQEPGGRWIQLVYVQTPWINSSTGARDVVIDHILASDGRTVNYTYGQAYYPPGSATYTILQNVTYYPDPSVPSPPVASYTYQAPNAGNSNGIPLLATAIDPMYAGPMKNISYTYATGVNSDNSTVVPGQIRSENSGATGQPVSSLGFVVSGRSETKGDGGFRNFLFAAGRVTSWSDFVNFRFASQHYDPTTGFVDSITDRNGNTTNIASDPITGNITSVTYPATPNDTAAGTPRGSIVFTYGSASCPDPNNRDGNNPYYLYSRKDEAGNETIYLRDANKRISQINYPDGGYETFQYDGFGQVTYHRLTTGGTEAFFYDPNTHVKSSYRDPYHDPVGQSGKPTVWYQYDPRGRLSGVTDWRGTGSGDLNYTTSYDYNLRGQLTKITHPVDPYTGARYTSQKSYNADGTLATATDENGHTTSYGYDDYKRVTSVSPPPAYDGDPLPRTTFFYYDRNGGTATDYTHTDSSVGNVTTPRGNTVKTWYDYNLLKRTVTEGAGNEAGTTTYTYDFAGNLKTVKDPAGQATGLYTEYFYDERNRLFAANDPIGSDRGTQTGYTVKWMYDAGGRKASEQRANDQLITYDSYDPMNRLLQQTVQRDDSVADITSMTYYPSGNLHTFTDARQKTYTYGYDDLSRRTSLTYPLDTWGVARTEIYHYDLANNMDTYTDRSGAVQTFTYDNRNRQIAFSWNVFPAYTHGAHSTRYDPVGNVLHNGAEGDDSDFLYDFRNRKKQEIETSGGLQIARTVGYTYDADSNRRTITYPSGAVFTYDYDSRDQLKSISDTASAIVNYTYDASGNRRTRTLRNGTSTTYTPDALNRPLSLEHDRGSTVLGRFDYGYDVVSRVQWVTRDSFRGDRYDYYLDDQLKSAAFEAYNPASNGYGASNQTSLYYDGNGNRTSQSNTGSGSYSYSANDLNQYSAVNGSAPAYDVKGNLSDYNGSHFEYDAQNRLDDAENATNALYFYYDGLGRQILRYVNGDWIYSVWDGWDLIEEYTVTSTLIHAYLHGAATDEMVQRWDNNHANTIWYHQDAQGSTSHLTDDWGNLIESYKYPPADSGAPAMYNASGQQIGASNFDNRFLYTGRDWLKQVGLYDYRNRFYLPTLGRFLQPDPLGFGGGDGNLYRYCAGDPVNYVDPSGLVTSNSIKKKDGNDSNNNPNTPVYIGSNPLEDGYEFGYDPNTGFGGTERVTVGGPPPEPGTGWGAGDSIGSGGPGAGDGSGPGGAGSPGDGSGSGRGRRGSGNGTGAGTPGGNPYLTSAPFIAEAARGIENYNLPAHAAFWEEYAQWVPTFLPFGGVVRGTRGAAAAASITFRTGHVAEHLARLGLTARQVEPVILNDVRMSIQNASRTGSFWGRVRVGGRTVEYRAFTLGDDSINVGTYYDPFY